MNVHRYRRELAHLVPARTILYPYSLRTICVPSDVLPLHALLQEAYAKGGGSVAPLETWWETLSADPEFDPNLVFVVMSPVGKPVAAAIAWKSGFIKDLVVAPAFRRQGLGSALLGHVCHTFQRRGALSLELKVEAHNHAAIALYEAMGMRRCDVAEVLA